MKKIDHLEFINRHHTRSTAVHGKSKSLTIAVIASIMSFYFVLMVFVVHMARVDQATIFISILVFLTATLVAFAAKRAQYLQAKQEEELILLKEVLEGSRGGRLITDSADNTLYYNQRFVKLCYHDVGAEGDEDVTYVQLVNMFSDNDKAASLFNALSDQAHRGLTDTIELYCEKQDYEGWYSVTAQPVAGHAGIIHWRLDNVTEKYTADRAIREEREKLVDFTDNAPVGFFSVDENGKFVFANATFARWLGVDLGYLLNQASLHTCLVYPPANAKPYDLIDHGSEKQIVELELKGAAGKTFRASINQSIVYGENNSVRTRAVVNDLTTEQEMHRALKASEDRFKRFYEDAPLGIVLVNKDGLIEDCNAQFAQLMDKDTENLVKKHFKLLIDDEDRDAVSAMISKIEKGEHMGESIEVKLHGDNEEVKTAQLHARSIVEGEGVVLHFLDMTEKKSLEEQFVQSQKMQAVGQLAGGIAHDFNNLLTAIIGFCDLLLLRHKPGDPSFGDIMQIQQNSNRAANLVRQLLAFSRQQTLRQRVHDITDILTELSHLMRRLIGANIDLQMIHGRDLGLVKVDEGQMEQVLINLAVNARDAMDGGGSLIITTENYTNLKTQEVMQEKMPPGHWVLIKVKDSGCGIPAKNMKRILEPFFTTKDVGEGTGLGLATVYGIVRQSGGFLDIKSVVGEGTTFLIYLPKANEMDVEEDEKEKPVELIVAKDLTGTECILLVEDEDAVRTFSQRALANKGYDVISAEHGEAALELFEMDGQKQIDLLITDVVMPGMDGPTLAQRIRQQSPELKIIFMSGYTEDKLKDYMGENTYFLPKPFTLKILAAKVKEVLGG
ncbi:MAG: hybrid sensor histidine kinase/response regulator [Zetaproteobacteria bacterium]|nr:MAG: hybrid sensor histidine kinase/response regulator [Zetaproteobacteria bacterium]